MQSQYCCCACCSISFHATRPWKQQTPNLVFNPVGAGALVLGTAEQCMLEVCKAMLACHVDGCWTGGCSGYDACRRTVRLWIIHANARAGMPTARFLVAHHTVCALAHTCQIQCPSVCIACLPCKLLVCTRLCHQLGYSKSVGIRRVTSWF
jgi:hypothetical protein